MSEYLIEADPPLDDEAGRLAALRALDVLDTGPEAAFDNIVELVRTVLGVSMASVSLIDEHRQWFKARAGIKAQETPRAISFCTYAIRQRQPFVVPDATEDGRFAHSPLVTDDPRIRAYAGIPLETSEGYNVGTLCAVDTVPREFSEHEIGILASFARIVVNELELRRIAARDQLTGVLTRRGLLDKAALEIARARRKADPAALVLLDIDHFKSINDTWGHAAGDTALRTIASVLSSTIRATDVLGRVGGEEFCVILPQTAADEALVLAERLRAAVESHPVEIAPEQPLTVTVSLGVAELTGTMANADAWMAVADQPLYVAKREGRNRVALANG